MTEINKLKETQTELNINEAPTQPKKVENDNLIILTGITTSQINQALKADNPYPARVFLKVDNQEQELRSNLNSFNKGLDQQLITLKGITTSQINQALKGKKTNGLFPYPARVFLKVENEEQDIPVFFRIKETPTYEGFIKSRTGKYINYSKCFNTSRGSKCTYEYAEQCGECSDKFKTEPKNCENWIKPEIKTGSLIEVQGHFTNSDKERKSFTATSYQLLSCPHSQKKPYFCPIDCPCLKKQTLNQPTQQQILTYGK